MAQSQSKPTVKVQTKAQEPAKAETKAGTVTYRMTNPGRTEGASGTVYPHEVRMLDKANGQKEKAWVCTVPEGEFDHLFFDAEINGRKIKNSKRILGKL